MIHHMWLQILFIKEVKVLLNIVSLQHSELNENVSKEKSDMYGTHLRKHSYRV